jgi:hypothetical protein
MSGGAQTGVWSVDSCIAAQDRSQQQVSTHSETSDFSTGQVTSQEDWNTCFSWLFPWWCIAPAASPPHPESLQTMSPLSAEKITKEKLN